MNKNWMKWWMHKAGLQRMKQRTTQGNPICFTQWFLDIYKEQMQITCRANFTIQLQLTEPNP